MNRATSFECYKQLSSKDEQDGIFFNLTSN